MNKSRTDTKAFSQTKLCWCEPRPNDPGDSFWDSAASSRLHRGCAKGRFAPRACVLLYSNCAPLTWALFSPALSRFGGYRRAVPLAPPGQIPLAKLGSHDPSIIQSRNPGRPWEPLPFPQEAALVHTCGKSHLLGPNKNALRSHTQFFKNFFAICAVASFSCITWFALYTIKVLSASA